MSEQHQNPVIQKTQPEVIEIDVMGIFTKMLRSWKRIFWVTFAFGAVGIAVALITPRKYSVTVTLAPELQGGRSSNANLYSMLGLSQAQLGMTSDALNFTLFPEICASTSFLTQLFDFELTPYLSPEEIEAGKTAVPTTVFDHVLGEDKPKKGLKKWLANLRKKDEIEIDESIIDPANLTEKQHNAVKALQNCITVNVDKKTGITTISVKMDDKLMVTQLAERVTDLLREYVIKYRTNKAAADYEYYVILAEEAHEKLVKAQEAYAASVDYDRSVILQSVNSEKQRLQSEVNLASQIYAQMVQQREMARAKIQEESPVYAIVQPATVPQFPANSRKKTVLIFGFLGFVLICGWVGFGKDVYGLLRGGIRKRLSEPEAAR